MDKQYKIWKDEHTKNEKFLPGHGGDKATGDVVYFNEKYISSYYSGKIIKVLDLGAGLGRNTLYFLKQGYIVYAMDFIEEALETISHRAKKELIDNKLKLIKGRLDEKFDFEENFFDVVIDSLSSIDIDSLKGRANCRDETYRTLKKNGLLLFRCVSTNDEFEKKLMRTNPGKEKNSSIWKGTGKYQKNFDYNELKNFYKKYEILELTEYKKIAIKLGKKFVATNFRLILKK